MRHFLCRDGLELIIHDLPLLTQNLDVYYFSLHTSILILRHKIFTGDMLCVSAEAQFMNMRANSNFKKS